MSKVTLQQMLKSLELCARCILRYSNNTLSAENYVDQVDNIQGHCGSCLSILEQTQIKSVVDQVYQLINEKQYTSLTFALAISFPQCLVLRHKSLLTHMRKTDHFDASIHDKTNLISVKDALKVSIISTLEDLTAKKHDNKSALLINVDYNYHDDVNEIDAIKSLLPKPTHKRKWQSKHNKVNQKSPVNSIQRITEVVDDIHDFNVSRYMQVPPQATSTACNITVTACHEPIYLAGRYNKYSRELSQTPWLIEGVRKTETSVQELISANLMKHSKSGDVKFMSSGREDCDVRMLGRGRPFVVGLIDPKRTDFPKETIHQFQQEINTSTNLIAVRDLQLIDKEGLTSLKSGEEEKTKSYSAKVWCPTPITGEQLEGLNNLKDVLVKQNTPVRVLHRRPICVRDRLVYTLDMHRLDENHYQLKLKTQAGTYIKEFVHSDFGRTVPSLCSLLKAPMDILELDVEEVELDWPPSLVT